MSIKEKLIELIKVRISLPEIKVDNVNNALDLSLAAFNMVPCVTYFTFEDEENIDQLKDLLITYASYVLLTSYSCTNDYYLNVARELWNNWESQVRSLKESDSFYEDFVQEVKKSEK